MNSYTDTFSWDGDPPFTEQLKEVADWYSNAPFEYSEFENAVQRLGRINSTG